MNRKLQRGMTLVEMLIAMAILGVVLLLTSSGIIQSLQVNRLAQETANTQSKLRRITEVITQELRSAVLGGLVNFPVASGSSSISFVLLDGDGGIQVTPSPGNSWHNSANTNVYASEDEALQDLIGKPAIMVNGNGDAVYIADIQHTPADKKVQHNKCKIPIAYTPNTRLYSVEAIGYGFDADSQILYQYTRSGTDTVELPFAFGLSRFEIVYEYETEDGEIVERSNPYVNEDGFPQPQYTQDDELHRLMRLRLTVAGKSDNEEIEREYVSYIELTGIGNDRGASGAFSNMTACTNSGNPNVETGNGNGNNGNGNGNGGGNNGNGNDGNGGGNTWNNGRGKGNN